MKIFETAYEMIVKMNDRIDTDCSGVDDDGKLWIYLNDGACFYFVPNDDGDLDVYHVHYSNMVSRLCTIETYPDEYGTNVVGTILDFLNTI